MDRVYVNSTDRTGAARVIDVGSLRSLGGDLVHPGAELRNCAVVTGSERFGWSDGRVAAKTRSRDGTRAGWKKGFLYRVFVWFDCINWTRR